MKTIITLVLAGELSRKEKAYLGNMLSDALDDFRAARGPTPEEYLMRRFKTGNLHAHMTEEAYVAKLQEIDIRTGLAAKLHNPALHVTVTEEVDAEVVPQLPQGDIS